MSKGGIRRDTINSRVNLYLWVFKSVFASGRTRNKKKNSSYVKIRWILILLEEGRGERWALFSLCRPHPRLKKSGHEKALLGEDHGSFIPRRGGDSTRKGLPIIHSSWKPSRSPRQPPFLFHKSSREDSCRTRACIAMHLYPPTESYKSCFHSGRKIRSNCN